MKATTIVQNWVSDTFPDVLHDIHQKSINIAIYQREIYTLEKDAQKLIKQNFEIKSSGTIHTIINEINTVLNPDEFRMIIADIKNLLQIFKKITGTNTFRLLLATINSNMCRKFHTDVNDLRLLCTYAGAGTLWLTEDNVNRNALHTFGNNETIVIDQENIQQGATGDVLILKGSKYQNTITKGVVHRSPTIENGEKRLLLRIDTPEFLKTCL